jgi:predicted dehydrogenase
VSTDTIAVGLVGYGKIARDQHAPSIAGDPRFHLAGVASPRSRAETAPTYPDLQTLLRERPEVEAVAVCTPPEVRHGIAREALEAGRHVLLEKPPAASISEAHDLIRVAEAKGLTLFATWHSRHAAGVEPARERLRGRTVRKVVVDWKEDVDKWHPGQAWIWTPAGMGVFDPGVNGLSILTRILPQEVMLTAARLHLRRPEEAPIAAELTLRTSDGAPVEVEFDWRPRDDDRWTIRVETDGGELLLSSGGAEMTVDGTAVELPPTHEYPGVYARFAELIAAGERDVDLRPLTLVADACLRGERDIL